MTHNDIYTKFLIEYDKANVTSSYPQLTEYEIATVLDKAYNALIAQKVTGNNYRRMPFEADIKAISDLQPLVVSEDYGRPFSDNQYIKNQLDFNLPDDFLYYVGSRLSAKLTSTDHKQNTVSPIDTPSEYDFSGLTVEYEKYELTKMSTQRPRQSGSTFRVQANLGEINVNTENANVILIQTNNQPSINNISGITEITNAIYSSNAVLSFSNGDVYASTSKENAVRLLNNSNPVFVSFTGTISDLIGSGQVLTETVIPRVDYNYLLLGYLQKYTEEVPAPTNLFIIPIEFKDFSQMSLQFDGNAPNTWYAADVSSSGVLSNVRMSSTLKGLQDSMNNLHYKIAIWSDRMFLNGEHLIWSESKYVTGNSRPYDMEVNRDIPCQIVDYNTAQRFFTTMYNMPWIKNPVCYIHGDYIHVLKEDDTISKYEIQDYVLTYIKSPATFVKHLVQSEVNQNFFDSTEFELNDTMAEELISLGIAYALENVESPRLNSKLNMRGLES